MRLLIEHAFAHAFDDGHPHCYLMLGVKGGASQQLQVRVPFYVASKIAPQATLEDLGPLTTPVIALVLERLGHLGEEGMASLLSAGRRGPIYSVEVSETDAPAAHRLLAEKVCRYREEARSEHFCGVAVVVPGDGHGAATTRHKCSACRLPDSRLACSNLHHPRIAFSPGADFPTLVRAQCDIGRCEVDQGPAECRPGGYECWEREVPFRFDPPIELHELALHELFDLLDARWKSAFGKHLLSSRKGTSFGRLAIPCTTAADLEAKLSALANILKVEVATGLLREEHQTHVDYGPDRHLARMESALERVLAQDPETLGVVKKATKVLRDANALRNSAQHGGSALVLRYAQFKLPYPPPAAPETWARVQAAVASALHNLADAIPEN